MEQADSKLMRNISVKKQTYRFICALLWLADLSYLGNISLCDSIVDVDATPVRRRNCFAGVRLVKEAKSSRDMALGTRLYGSCIFAIDCDDHISGSLVFNPEVQSSTIARRCSKGHRELRAGVRALIEFFVSGFDDATDRLCVRGLRGFSCSEGAGAPGEHTDSEGKRGNALENRVFHSLCLLLCFLWIGFQRWARPSTYVFPNFLLTDRKSKNFYKNILEKFVYKDIFVFYYEIKEGK